MKLTEVIEAIDFLRKAGWTIKPPMRRGSISGRVSAAKRVGRPPRNGRRKRGRPRKDDSKQAL